VDLALDTRSPVPLYRQLFEELRRRILLGALRPGDKLPTVRELAVLARVNRNTAARAVRALEEAGLVTSRVGRGTFVTHRPGGPGTDPALSRAVDELLDRLIDEVRRLGADPAGLPDRLAARLRAHPEPSPFPAPHEEDPR